MPTARELLEQADALMRRNRARDSVQKMPALATAAPDIPVLTEVVETHAPLGAAMRANAPAMPDVPVLTEAVEEIEAPPVVADVEQGDPSFWLDNPDDDKSVLGAAPDSVAVVPSPEIVPPPRVVPFDVPAASRAAPPILPTAAAGVSPARFVDEPVASTPAAEFGLPVPPVPVVEDVPATSTAALAGSTPAPARAEPLEPPASIDVTPVEIDITPVEIDATSVEIDATTVEIDATTVEIDATTVEIDATTMEIDATQVEIDATPVEIDVPRAPVAAVPPTGDDDRWQQLAEDVRMQVLQRIDIFTDTGLREQLGAQLKPIVDRASADLVATINQHVGELLRSYVAQAIEREIERWRRDGER